MGRVLTPTKASNITSQGRKAIGQSKRFYVGYNKDRDEALVEVKDAYCEIYVDEQGVLVEYEYDGKLWVAERVVYELGKVLEKKVKK